ncbi:MAG: hypothetical protein ABIP74_02260 [Candidatus Saccharimonas sp.]
MKSRLLRVIGALTAAIIGIGSTVISAVPASAATTACGITANWLSAGTEYPSTLYHTTFRSRVLSNDDMQFCLTMTADKSPTGRKMKISIARPGTDISASTTGSSVYVKTTLTPGQQASSTYAFSYDNPAYPNGVRTVTSGESFWNYQ